MYLSSRDLNFHHLPALVHFRSWVFCWGGEGGDITGSVLDRVRRSCFAGSWLLVGKFPVWTLPHVKTFLLGSINEQANLFKNWIFWSIIPWRALDNWILISMIWMRILIRTLITKEKENLLKMKLTKIDLVRLDVLLQLWCHFSCSQDQAKPCFSSCPLLCFSVLASTCANYRNFKQRTFLLSTGRNNHKRKVWARHNFKLHS